MRGGEGGGREGDLSGLLPDGRIVLDGEDRLPLLQHTRSAALAGSLEDDKALYAQKNSFPEHTLFLTRRASIWSVRTLVRVFSALALWMYSMRTRLFLKTLPLDFW